MRPVDDAGLQFILAIQDGLRGGNRIPAADQEIPLEVHFSGWKDHPNGEKCGDETFREISFSRAL